MGVHQGLLEVPTPDSSLAAESLNEMVGLGGLEPPTSPLSGAFVLLYV